MAFTYFEIGISLVILFFHFFILYTLFKLKLSLLEEFSETIVYFRISVLVLIALRIQAIFSRAGFLNVFYLQDILALVLAVFLLLGFHSFYKSINGISEKKRKGKN